MNKSSGHQFGTSGAGGGDSATGSEPTTPSNAPAAQPPSTGAKIKEVTCYNCFEDLEEGSLDFPQ